MLLFISLRVTERYAFIFERDKVFLGVNIMPYCPRCGKEVSNEIKFCPQCGGALDATAQPEGSEINVRVPVRANIPQRTDLLGLVSAGIILVILGFTYFRYTIDFSVITNYIQNMANSKVFVKPPLVLIDPMIFFFYAVGVWGIILSGLRVFLEKSVRKALSDLFGCFFAFFCAFLLSNYAANVLTTRMVGAYFIIAIGLLIAANALVSLALREK